MLAEGVYFKDTKTVNDAAFSKPMLATAYLFEPIVPMPPITVGYLLWAM